MYFDYKRNQDPHKIWIPGIPAQDVMLKMMEKLGFSSYLEIHNMSDVINHITMAPMAKPQMIYIKPDIHGDVHELVNIIQSCMDIVGDSGYILVDYMFPYYEEFKSSQYQAFIKCRLDTNKFQFNTLWDCSYGLGVITKGEDQYAVYNIGDPLNIDFKGFEYFFSLCMNPVKTDLFLYNLKDKYDKYKYSVITAIFDGYEMLREVQNPRHDVEYVVVTDDPNLTSKTWKIKLIDTFFDDMSGYAKSFYVKYHPFEFIESDTFIWVDGSIQIKDDFTDEIMKPFIESNYEIFELVNTICNKGDYELNRWYEHKFHGFDKEQRDLALKLFDNEGWIDETQVQTTIYGGKNTKLLNLVNNRTWDIMRRDSGNNHDITILYMPQRGKVLSKYLWNTHKVYYFDSCTLYSRYFDYCFHNSKESQKADWDNIGNNLENDIWGFSENPLYPKKVSKQ